MNVRLAVLADANAGSDVLRRSISELCYADHRGDPAYIAVWIVNKTPESWQVWLAQPDTSLFVAEREGAIVGVGMVDGAGSILLNYVAPEARYDGVSTALLRAMEEVSFERGVAVCMLKSTKTAGQFYIARGYAPAEGGDSSILAKRLS